MTTTFACWRCNTAKHMKARFQLQNEDGSISCLLCPHRCKLTDGQRGRCRVRYCQDNQLWTGTYGHPLGLAVDPVEKKPLYHFHPGTQVLSFGTAGCNFSCKFCQNATMSMQMECDEQSPVVPPKDIAHAAVRQRAEGVAYTYNEPTIFAEYAIDCALACSADGLHNIAVSNGYIRGPARREFFTAMDAANIDLKSFDPAFYRDLCGAKLSPVLDTLEYVANTPCWLEVTTLLIPGINDDPALLGRQFNWMREHLGPHVPLHLSAFFPHWKMQDLPPTSAIALKKARIQAIDCGLNYVYTGNIHDPSGSTTTCTGCGATLIQRTGLTVDQSNLRGGVCTHCATPLHGCF